MEDQTCPTCRRGKDTDGDGNCPVCSKYAKMKPSRIITAIRSALGPHLLKGVYKRRRPANAKPSWGTCYVASEALYHLWGKTNGYSPMCVPYVIESHAQGIHWFLEQRTSGLQVDITADQFEGRTGYFVPDFTEAKAKGFMTRKPSKRAKLVIDAVLEKIPV